MSKQDSILIKINFLISLIDEKVECQLKALHKNTRFKQLKASWVGLHYAVACLDKTKRVKLRVLTAKWEEVQEDLYHSTDVIYTAIYDKIHNQEYGMPGGEPYSLVIGDFTLDINKVTNHSNLKEINTLKLIAEIAAMSFTVFITSLHANVFGVSSYPLLSKSGNIGLDYTSINLRSWLNLRMDENAKFLGFVIPSITMTGYYNKSIKHFRSCFRDETQIWSNAIYVLAASFINSFQTTGWFLDAVGMIDYELGISGGIKRDIEPPKFSQSDNLFSNQTSTDVVIAEKQELKLNTDGIVVLLQKQNGKHIFFGNCPSIRKVTSDSHADALSAQIPYILSICRFAHYLKILGRDNIGLYKNVKECELHLQNWLNQYVASNDDITSSMKIRYPLRAGKVTLTTTIGNPNKFSCRMVLSPQLRVNQISTVLTLGTMIEI